MPNTPGKKSSPDTIGRRSMGIVYAAMDSRLGLAVTLVQNWYAEFNAK